MDLLFARRFLRSVVPLTLRRHFSSLKRARHDKASGHAFASDLVDPSHGEWTILASVTQPLILAPHLEEKRANLAKAIAAMNGLIIKPGQILSVWHCLGAPTADRGWASGRTIINDVMTTDPGGGLCQFSSLIYHLGLLAGLNVVERHHHSRDIHVTDVTRFTALGLDATIVFGFKDLRMRNDSGGTLMVIFDLTPVSMSGRILGQHSTPPRSLHIARQDADQSRSVVVSYVGDDGMLDVISRDCYLV